jgi:hypothetical protein
MIIPLRKIKEGESIPKWYGVTRLDPEKSVVVCYPVPVNVVIRVFAAIKYRMKIGLFKSKREQELIEAYNRGLKEGMSRCSKRPLGALEKIEQECMAACKETCAPEDL